MAHSSPEPPDRSTGSAARNTRRPRHRPDTGPAIRIREEKRPMKRRRTRILALAATALAVLAGIVYVQGPAEAATTRYEAENATISQGVVESNHLGFSGTGFVDYNNVAGSFVQFTVTAGSSGPQSLAFRYANGSTANRPMDIAVNGTVVSAGLAFNPTTDWDTWATVTINATLNAGSNTVRATATGAAGGPNLDRLRVSIPTDTVRPTPPGQPVCSNIMDTSLTLTWGASTDNVGVVAYDIFHD